MHLSTRLGWDVPINPLSILVSEKRHAGIQILDLTESNPTHAGFEYPSGRILAALADPRAMHYDPSPRGLESARSAVSAYYAERGAEVDPSRVLLTASTSEAYSYLFKLLADPGDEILAPRPSYPLFEFLAGMESLKVRQYPLRYEGAWHVDFPALTEAITERTCAIVVVNPNNPTGSFLKCEEWERLQELAATHGVAILSDEVFSDYALIADPSRADSMAVKAPTFAMSGLSKIAGLPQMKLGWIVASGHGHEKALDRLEWIADTYLSVATPVQYALPELLEATRTIREQILARVRANLAFLRQSIEGTALDVLSIEGGWYATLQIPRTRTEEEWVLGLLRESDTLVQPGFFFDFESEAYLVLSLITPSAIFQDGLRRIIAFIR